MTTYERPKSMFGIKPTFVEQRKIFFAMTHLTHGIQMFDIRIMPIETKIAWDWLKFIPLQHRRAMGIRDFVKAKRNLEEIGV